MGNPNREPVRIEARNINEAAPLLVRVSAAWEDPASMMRGTTSVLYTEPLEVAPSWPVFRVNPFVLFFDSLRFVTDTKDPVYRFLQAPGPESIGAPVKPSPLMPEVDPFARVFRIDRGLVSFRKDRTNGILDVYSFEPESDPTFEFYRVARIAFLAAVVANEERLKVGTHERVLADFRPDRTETKEAIRGLEVPPERTLRPLYPTTTVPLCSLPEGRWSREADTFGKHGGTVSYTDPFFQTVAVPMFEAAQALEHLKGAERYDAARNALRGVAAGDWRTAAHELIDAEELKWKSTN